MLLFQKRFHEGLVSGAVTLTFRAWQKPLVKPGGRYRCHPIGVLEVDAIDKVPVSSITDEEAKQAGFADRAQLVAYLAEVAPDIVSSRRSKAQVFRVRLRHGGDGDRVPEALQADVTDDDCAAIAARLRQLDDAAAAPWTAQTLALIDARPRTAASQLARDLGRETAPFKAGVVKLKKLGLTQSFEVGYELSPRGRAYLDRAPPPPIRAESARKSRLGKPGSR